MQYEEELELFEKLGKGKVEKGSSFYHAKDNHPEKYHHYKKGSQTSFTPRKAADMVRIAQKKTQAIYKISSFGKGEQRVRAHLRYITRNGNLELEDEKGNKFSSNHERYDLVNNWSIDFGNNDRCRDTMHLVLSTPPGTDRNEAKLAAKEFLDEEYGKSGHEYVFVAHEDTNHPHVHAVIKMTSSYGNKLNPRKAYLRKVREHFAQKCREHGIDVEASSRCERGLSGSSKRSEFVQMKRNSRVPYKDKELIEKIKSERQNEKAPFHPSDEKMVKRNQIIRKRYAEKAKMLEQKAHDLSNHLEKEKHLKASKLLDDYAKEMPIETTRGEQVHRQLDAKYGIGKNRSVAKDTRLDEYNAVTNGMKDEQGTYKSLNEIVKQNISQIISKTANNSKERCQEQAKELDLDVDD